MQKQSASEFLASRPGLIYSSLRTTASRTKIIQFKAHLVRLAALEWKAEITIQLKLILNQYNDGEVFFIIVATKHSPFPFDIYHDKFTLPEIPKPVAIMCFGDPRINPNIKSTDWVTDRKYIEERKPSWVSEMILVSNGRLYEGTKTNIFGIYMDNGQIVIKTAPWEYVLKGTVASMIFEVCSDLGIEIRKEFIELDSNLIAAFLTSSFRYVQPISGIALENGNLLQLESCLSIIKQIQEALISKLISTAELLE